MEKAGVSVVTASLLTGQITGVKGLNAISDLTLAGVSTNDYDAVVYIGGGGAQVLFTNQDAQRIAKDAAAQNKVLAAICVAPATLANAGVLRGKMATAFGSVKAILSAGGAVFTGAAVEIDGNIITADGPGSADQFGQAIFNALK